MSNEMPKLYYDCPFSAAYMQEHFDVKFLCYPTPEQAAMETDKPWDWKDTCIYEDCCYVEVAMVGGAIECLKITPFDATGKIYVSPESMGIYRPKFEDSIVDDVGIDRIVRKIRMDSVFWYGDHGDYAGCNTNDIEITRRDNKSFIWPKREEA